MSRLARLDVAGYRDWLIEADFHGVVHVAGDDDEEPMTLALGLADRVAGLAMHAGTRIACASTTKMLTGLTVARLVDRGDLRYEDRYADLVPLELRPRDLDARVTLEQLLSHTSGVGDYADEYDGPPFEAIWETTTPARIRGPRDTLELMRDLPRTGEPGAAARYNNGAYILLGLAVEEVTGLAFPDAVRREVFEPLGMTASGFWPLDGLEPDLAVGYVPPDENHPAWRTNVYSTPALGGPDGGAQVTASDMVRALDGLLGRGSGQGFLTDATRARVTTVVAASPEEGVGYGLGAIRVGEGPSARIGHAGEDPGASSRCWAYDLGERVVVLSNVTEASWPALRVWKRCLGRSRPLDSHVVRRIVLLVSSVLLTIVTAGAGAFTLVLGLVHLAIPRLVGYRGALAVAAFAGNPDDAHQLPALPRLAAFGRAYRLRPDDLIGITWVMSNAASYVLITIGLVDLGWALGWRGVPVALGALWIAGWWGVRAVSQFALGHRAGDLLVAAWFVTLAATHVILALAGA